MPSARGGGYCESTSGSRRSPTRPVSTRQQPRPVPTLSEQGPIETPQRSTVAVRFGLLWQIIWIFFCQPDDLTSHARSAKLVDQIHLRVTADSFERSIGFGVERNYPLTKADLPS